MVSLGWASNCLNDCSSAETTLTSHSGLQKNSSVHEVHETQKYLRSLLLVHTDQAGGCVYYETGGVFCMSPFSGFQERTISFPMLSEVEQLLQRKHFL